MTFSEQFKTARKEAGFTQQALADATGIPKRTVEDWERGISSPPEWCQRLVLAEIERQKEDR